MQQQTQSKIQISLAHLSMFGQCHPYFYWAMHILGVVQILSVVVDSESTIYRLFFWAQPSSYLSASALSLLAAVFAFSLILMIVARYISTESSLPLVKASLCLSYVDRIIQYSCIVGRSILIVPFTKAIFLEFNQATSNQYLILASITISAYLIILYPLFLYTSLGSGALTPHLDNKIHTLNAEFITNIFKFILPLTSVYSSTATVVLCSFFVFFLLIAIIKRPVFSYSYNKFKTTIISIVCFACFCRISNAVSGKLSGDIITEVLGMICFPALIEVISRNRIKSIIKQDKKSVYQLKLLLFMIGEIDYYRDLLDAYIIKHQKECAHVECKCRNLVDTLASKDTQQNQASAWYEFLAIEMENTFDLQEIVKLPKSEMVERTLKYSSVVFEIAEIHILQLKNLNKANLLMEKYRVHLLNNRLVQTWNSRRYNIVIYYLQQAILEKVKASTVINVYANKYLHFQAEFIKYFELLLSTANTATDLWAELAKVQPTESIISKSIGFFEKAEIKIRRAYTFITQNYEGCNKIVDPITKEFYEKVYNIQESDPFHVIPYSQFALPPKKIDKKTRLNENFRIFSHDSETPMFFFSVLPQSFGKIQQYNTYFEDLMYSELGQVSSIDQLILPELRQSYLQSLKKAVLEDTLSLVGQEKFLIGSKLQLLPAQYMIQIVPSIGKGLRYACFVKKFQADEKMLILKDGSSIPYRSKALDKLLDIESCLLQLITAIERQGYQDLKQNASLILEIAGQQLNLTLVQTFRQADCVFQCFSLTKETSNRIEDLQSKIIANNNSQLNLQFHFYSHSEKKSVKFIGQTKKDIIKQQEPIQMQESQGKDTKSIKELYAVLLNENIGRKIRKSLNIVMFCGCLIVIGLFLACIFTKIDQKERYFALADAYEALSNLTITIGDVTTDLKLLNLYHYQNMSTQAVYQRLLRYPSVSGLRDTAFSCYSYEDYTQQWNFLRLNESGSLTAGTMRNYNMITDYLQLPLANLKTTNTSSFSFAFSLNYLKPPLNSTQIFFHQFITNALYFVLPNLREMSTNVLKPILREQQSPSYKITVFSLSIIATILLSLLLLMFLQRKLLLMMNLTHRFMEAINIEVVNVKKEQCKALVAKYRPALFQANDYSEKTSPLQSHEAIVSYHTSRGFSNLSERELDTHIPISPKEQPFTFQQQLQDVIASPSSTQRRKRQVIFKDGSFCKLAILYILPASIFVVFAVAFLVLQNRQSSLINQIMYLLNGIGFTLEDLVMIHTYSLHFGVYDYSLQVYQNIPKFLATRIYQMFYIFQLILTSIGASISSKSKIYWQTISYNNICNLEQQGQFLSSPYQFDQRGNFTYCSSIANSILTKGFMAAMLSYLQKANNLFLGNPATVMYTPQQKLAYLNDPFFTDTARLLDYFKLVLGKSTLIMRQDLNDVVNSISNILVYSSIALILGLAAFLLFIRPIFIARFNRDLAQIRGFFLLLSHRTVSTHPNLRQHFTNHLDELKHLK